MADKARKMKAWLVTWEWCGDHAKQEERVAAIFKPRLSGDRVRDLVEFIYLSERYSLSEKAECARDKKRYNRTRQSSEGRLREHYGLAISRVGIIRIFTPALSMI